MNGQSGDPLNSSFVVAKDQGRIGKGLTFAMWDRGDNTAAHLLLNEMVFGTTVPATTIIYALATRPKQIIGGGI